MISTPNCENAWCENAKRWLIVSKGAMLCLTDAAMILCTKAAAAAWKCRSCAKPQSCQWLVRLAYLKRFEVNPRALCFHYEFWWYCVIIFHFWKAMPEPCLTAEDVMASFCYLRPCRAFGSFKSLSGRIRRFSHLVFRIAPQATHCWSSNLPSIRPCNVCIFDGLFSRVYAPILTFLHVTVRPRPRSPLALVCRVLSEASICIHFSVR